ncbi:hypothetical protein [Microbacterium sp. BDGP8]|uniref:hypothetical protein n=1 Tax=Microbacterium sp. BDGP8 TaxID=3035531 RepID=UPI00249DAAA4|nr:hypothetical protein [Microbacterium sp. BDGP8]WHE35166.1 hypothetical protein P6897_10705 [Microbacterium sp. BDGP8]
MTNAVAVHRELRSFRYEADMMPVLRRALPRLAFRHESNSPVEVFSEVPAVHGVPDLAGVRFDFERIAARAARGVRPLTTDAEVRAVLAVGDATLTTREIADRTRMSSDYVRRAVAPLLIEQGWMEWTEENRLRRRQGAQWVGKRVVTVEAKLRDWRRALTQARRQQLSADAAYIALDASTVSRVTDHLAEIARGGVGVIAVDCDQQRARVLVRPNTTPDSRRAVGRALLAERSLEMMLRGTREGQIYPVFGWTAPHLT